MPQQLYKRDLYTFTDRSMTMIQCDECLATQKKTELWTYSFENHVHYVCRTCHNVDASDEYVHEIQTINQDCLTLLQRDNYNSGQHVLTLEQQDRDLDAAIALVLKQKQTVLTEISACEAKMSRYAFQIAALTEKLKRGRLSQTRAQRRNQSNARRPLQNTVCAKLPPADDRSQAWMLLMRSRLGSEADCRARLLSGADLDFDKTRQNACTQ